MKRTAFAGLWPELRLRATVAIFALCAAYAYSPDSFGKIGHTIAAAATELAPAPDRVDERSSGKFGTPYAPTDFGSSSEARACVVRYNSTITPAWSNFADAVVQYNAAHDALASPADVPAFLPIMSNTLAVSQKAWSALADFDKACGQKYADVSIAMGLAAREITSIQDVMAKAHLR
jgi:hypothetical protein